MAVHPSNNNLIASTDLEGKVCIWDPYYTYPLDIQVHETNTNLPGVSFIQKGESLLTLGHDKNFKIFQLVNK